MTALQYLNPRSSAGNCSWRLFPSSNIFLNFESREDPKGLFSFRSESESCIRPMLKIPSKIELCSWDGKKDPKESIARCTAKILKKKLETITKDMQEKIHTDCKSMEATWISNGGIKTKSSRHCHCCSKVLDAQCGIKRGNLTKIKNSPLSPFVFGIEYNSNQVSCLCNTREKKNTYLRSVS